MVSVAIWARRGSGPYLALAVLLFVPSSLLSQPSWKLELDRATRLTAATLIVVTPVVAAVVAFDVALRYRPTLADLSRASLRHWGQVCAPAPAVVLWVMLAHGVVWVIAAVLVARQGGVGVTDWWVFPEVGAPLAAAGAVGLVVGLVVPPRWAAVSAAVVVLVAAVVASPWGRGPFEAVTTYGTLTGLDRPANRFARRTVSPAAAVVGGPVTSRADLSCARQHGCRDARRWPEPLAGRTAQRRDEREAPGSASVVRPMSSGDVA